MIILNMRNRVRIAAAGKKTDDIGKINLHSDHNHIHGDAAKF